MYVATISQKACANSAKKLSEESEKEKHRERKNEKEVENEARTGQARASSQSNWDSKDPSHASSVCTCDVGRRAKSKERGTKVSVRRKQV